MRVLIDTNVLISAALLTLGSVPVPTDENASEAQIRDINDRPVLRVAINAKANVLLTDDKDFLGSGLKAPKIMTSAKFLDMDQRICLYTSSRMTDARSDRMMAEGLRHAKNRSLTNRLRLLLIRSDVSV